MNRSLAALLALGLPILAQAAGVGQSPYIYGMHDMPDSGLLAG